MPRGANTIRAIADGVIVVLSEMRSDGPWTADFGVYAIALESGDLLWTSHREGLAGTVCKAALDHVPGFTNELRDRPKRVQDGEVPLRERPRPRSTLGASPETRPRRNRRDIDAPSLPLPALAR